MIGGFLAQLRDSFREAADQRALYMLLALGAVLVLVCASVRFEEREPKAIAEAVSEEFSRYSDPFDMTVGWGDAQASVTDVVARDDAGRFTFVLRYERSLPLREAWCKWEESKSRAEVPKSDAVTDAQVVDWITERLRMSGALDPSVAVLAAAEGSRGPIRLGISFAATLDHLDGAHDTSLFFGQVALPMPGGKSSVLAFLMFLFAEKVVGWIGVMVALIVTAGFVPAALRRGRVDFLLTRPLSRLQLLLGKYFGGLGFIGVVAFVIVGASWAVLSRAAGIWSPLPLLSVGVLTFFFAVLYAASVCIGVLTRSTTAVTFVTLGLWAMCSVVGTIHQTLRFVGDVPAFAKRAVGIAHEILPRTADIGLLDAAIIKRAYLPEGVGLPGMGPFTVDDAWRSLAVSSAWIVFFLAVAWWRFRKRDV